MATKRQPPQLTPPGTAINNSHIQMHCGANEYTRDAATALAAAVQANAEAIAQIAKALCSNAPAYGIYVASKP